MYKILIPRCFAIVCDMTLKRGDSINLEDWGWGCVVDDVIACLLDTSDAADEEDRAELGWRRVVK